MIIRRIAIVTLVLSASLAASAQAETPAGEQVAAGRNFARRVCGACHVVT